MGMQTVVEQWIEKNVLSACVHVYRVKAFRNYLSRPSSAGIGSITKENWSVPDGTGSGAANNAGSGL